MHPVRVAESSLAYYKDTNLIIAALLHDTLEDCSLASYKEIYERFGEVVAHLVQALTKLKKESRAISVERIFKLAQSDARVLLIKLMDRLDNLSDLSKLARHRQISNATESMIYATVTEGIGLSALASQIRNKAFEVLYPRRYKQVHQAINEITKTNSPFFNEIEKEMMEIVGAKNCLRIFTELKTPFDFANPKTKVINILNKMYVLVDEPLNCYLALGKLHSKLPVIPSRFHDYLANPLGNGWQGLTTGVIAKGMSVELWITTYNHYIKNQFGIFAQADAKLAQTGSYQEFIDRFSDLLDDSEINLDQIFRAQYHQNTGLSNNQAIQVISPKGETVNLNLGAIVLDYAYAIPSEIGNSCVGAIINHQTKVSPFFRLPEGSIVEVLTDKHSNPNEKWLKLVVMPHSRKAIMSYLKRQEKLAKSSSTNS